MRADALELAPGSPSVSVRVPAATSTVADRWLTAAALAACWGPWCWRLARVWSLAPEQAYGWAVPGLAFYLMWERRRDEPRASIPAPAARHLATILLVGGLLLFALALPILEANPLWPTAQWLATTALVLVTLAAGARSGGWRWAAHYAFPLVFLFTALTWPTPVNVRLVSPLAASGARLVADLVSTLGYPATASGHVIEVSQGYVGIDEACSGWRSFQAVWMAAWFFGELGRLTGSRRLGLVALALGAAWATNLARICFLTWQAAAHGIEAGARWHDTAGAVEMVAALLVVAALAWWITPRVTPRPLEENPSSISPPPRGWSFARSSALVLLAGGLLAETFTQTWYGWHELAAAVPRVHWWLAAPTAVWRPVGLPTLVTDTLHYTRAQGLEWRDGPDGVSSAAYVVAWQGDVAQGESSEWHDPTLCVPAAGAQLVRDLGPAPIVIDGVNVVFNSYLFAAGGRPLTVYFCHWDAETGPTAEPPADIATRRLTRVWQGRRSGDVAHLTLVVEVAGAAATDWFHTWAPRLLQTHAPGTQLSEAVETRLTLASSPFNPHSLRP